MMLDLNCGLSVGKSDRTSGKHVFLDKTLGKFVGALSAMFNGGRNALGLQPPFVMIDCCAGDAIDTIESGTSSPHVFNKHRCFLQERCGKGGYITIFIEKDKSTFDLLKKSEFVENSHLILGDARDKQVIEQVMSILSPFKHLRHPCFIHNDPNKILDWTITQELLNVCGEYTTTFSTLGCNVSGIKRLPRTKRQWEKKVKPLLEYVDQRSFRLGAYLLALQDKSQWAYLVTTPISKRGQWAKGIEDAGNSAFKYWENGHQSAWLSDREAFTEIATKLFLTAEERKNGELIRF